MKLKLNLNPKISTWHQKRNQERKQVVEFIKNHAAKKEFVGWLNAQYKQSFAEDAEWEDIASQILQNENIRAQALHNYASSLTKQEDVKHLLKNVEKETAKAEETVSRLYDLTATRKLAVATGGASLLGGVILLTAAALLVSDVIHLDVSSNLRWYMASVGGVFGVLNLVAGTLLTSQ